MHNFLPKQYYFIDQFDKKNIDKLKINTGIIYRNYTNKLNKKLISTILLVVSISYAQVPASKQTTPVLLKNGDEITIEIEGIGRLTNPVQEE